MDSEERREFNKALERIAALEEEAKQHRDSINNLWFFLKMYLSPKHSKDNERLILKLDKKTFLSLVMMILITAARFMLSMMGLPWVAQG